MNRYTVYSLGYECCPSFPTLQEARAHLRAIVAEEYAKAKRRYPRARKHKSDDAYQITLGPDKRSALWSAHSIQIN